MNRKLLAVATTLLMIGGLIVASASAGPGAGRAAREDGTLEALSAGDVPVSVRQAGAASPAKAAPAQAGLQTAAQPQAQAQAPAKPAQGKISPQLADELKSAGAGAELHEVLVTTSVDPASLATRLARLNVTRTFHRAMTGFAASLTAAQIRELEKMAEVEQISADEKVQADLENANRWTGVTKLIDDFGVTGDGDGFELRYSTRDVVVAVIDTGIDARHKDLKGKVLGWQDMVNGRTQPYDDNGHGTHVSGIVAGAGRANRNMKGVAPGAALVGVKVLDEGGSGWFSDVIGGIDWVVENKDKFNIRVLKTDRV